MVNILDQQPNQFPWQMFLEAQQAQNQNQQQMYKDIRGIGTGLGQIGQTAGWHNTIDQLMQDPAMPVQYKPYIPLLKSVPPEQGLGLVQSILKSQARQKGSQTMYPVAYGPNGLRTLTPGGTAGVGGAQTAGDMSAKPGEIPGELSYKDMVTKLTAQAGQQEAARKYETTLKGKSDVILGPIKQADETISKLQSLYEDAVKAGEVGAGKGRLGSMVGSVTGGKKFAKLAEFQRFKNASISTLFKGLGVNRFTMGEVQNLVNNLSKGEEDPVVGRKLLRDMKDLLRASRTAAMADLDSQMTLYRIGSMGGAYRDYEPPAASAPESSDPAAVGEE